MSKKNSTTGIIRHIDNLGRVVIPKEMRKALLIKEGDAVEICRDGDSVYIKKPNFTCKFCDTKLTEVELEKKFQICVDCENEIKSL